MYVETGHCPKCGALIYAESPWWGTIPPPPRYTCGCNANNDRIRIVTTTSTNCTV